MLYLHHVEGRLRVRSPRVRRADAAAVAVRQLLEGVGGVERVTTSTVTGSVTIFYDPARTSAEALVVLLQRHGYLSRSMTLPQPTAQAEPESWQALGSAAGKLGAVAARMAAEAAIEKLVERAAIVAVRALI